MVRVMLPRIADDRPMMPFDAVEPVAIDANPVMVPIKMVPPPVRSKEADVDYRTPPEAIDQKKMISLVLFWRLRILQPVNRVSVSQSAMQISGERQRSYEAMRKMT